MAGRMVEAVAGELSKLREKAVRIKAIDVGQNLSKFKAARVAAQVEVGRKEGGEGKQLAKANVKASSFMTEEEEDEGCLSESTVCLLMDRFVPC